MNARQATESREVIEARFIAAVIKDGEGDRLRECRALDPEAFEDPRHSRVWRTIVNAASYEAAALSADVRPFFGHETTGTDYENDRSRLFIGFLERKGLDYAPQWVATLPARSSKANLLSRLAARRFNHASAPAKPTPRFLINGKSVCTPGNLTNIIAQAKAGKSALVAAALAAAICAEVGAADCDTLGITSTVPGPKKLLHFDTEQSPYDHDQLVRRALRRAGVDEPPAWLESYGLAGFSAAEIRSVVSLTVRRAHAEGGVFAIIIDGTADLVADVNDATECNAFVAELHALAIEYDCPILNVVHENPGQDGGKMRGHLGSQLERKAESNLRLKKSDEITVVFSERMRGAPILEKDGPRFHWNDSVGMHTCAPSNATLREADSLADLRDLAEEVFSGRTLRYAEACVKIETARRVGEKAAEKWFTRMKKANVIQKMGMGQWEVVSA